MGIKPVIYQWASQPFNKKINNLIVKGIPVLHIQYKKRSKALFKFVLTEIDANNDIVVFGSDQQSVRSNLGRTVSIQHGVSWDLPIRIMTSNRFLNNEILGKL